MFITHYSNQPEQQKDTLLFLLENTFPLDDPFAQEIILVQSPGMAQWLQMEIAQKRQIAANLAFPMPASFIWQLYADNLANVAKQNPFDKTTMTWRLMRIIPDFLENEAFAPLKGYLASAPQSQQHKLYQLSLKIADLFDQYLVYRPDWIRAWEANQESVIYQQIAQQYTNQSFPEQLQANILWQGILWRALLADTQADFTQPQLHRAALNQAFLERCASDAPMHLPERIFIFGIPALPAAYFEVLQAISKRIDVHFFFNSPSREYWGELRDKEAQEATGNQLLTAWGKLGRDFLYNLVDAEAVASAQSIETYRDYPKDSLLGQLQNQILNLVQEDFSVTSQDKSICLNSCHSPMREVEVLHDYLLRLFNENKGKPKAEQITPKDVVVMAADINQYTPYIQAVFGQNQGAAAIPFSISDNKLTESDVLVATFLNLLNMRESNFAAEDVLALLNVPALAACFEIHLQDLPQIRQWVRDAGIRFGAEHGNLNLNAWQSGLERMALGYALGETQGVWEDCLGLDSSFGLKGQLVGHLAEFFNTLAHWQQILQQSYTGEIWQQHLTQMLQDFFYQDEKTATTLFYLQDAIDAFAEDLALSHFYLPLEADVVLQVFTEKLAQNPSNQRFLAGKVNFCTLLPMRAIPFKVVCLLGMNDGDYPRLHTPNSFDLMQYHHLRGDRVRRDDDRYLFLEAILSARQHLYISYIGRSIIDNQAKEPSVLVNQLLAYLAQHGAPLEPMAQSMMPFSPENFTNKSQLPRSFAAKWLPLAKAELALEEFAVAFPEFEKVSEIELDDLVRFVENPLKFFFERRLGVYFREDEEEISDHENFTIDTLDNYQLNNALLHLPESEFSGFFVRETHKGIMPRGNFAQIYAEKITQQVCQFKEKIAAYQNQQISSEFINLKLETEVGNVRVFGQITSLFGPQKQCISWHFANGKDRYRVRPWIYYLLQLQQDPNVPTPLLFVGNLVKPITFPSLTPEQALAQLQIYVRDFCLSSKEIKAIPTEDIGAFLEMAESAEIDVGKVLAKLEKLAQGDRYSKGDLYWARLLGQSTLFKEAETLTNLLQQVQSWFAKMYSKA